MNGRIYDPLMGRFLSADIVVQHPGSLQSYNRYSYVGNNPLTVTDPSGFFGSYPGFDKDAKAARDLAAKVLQNTRVQGALKVAGALGEGAAATTLAATPEPTMLTKVAAVSLGAHAADLGAAGMKQLVTGQDTKTMSNQAAASTATSLGASPQTAAQVGNMADALPAATAGAVGLGQLLTSVDNLAAAAPKAASAASEIPAAPATVSTPAPGVSTTVTQPPITLPVGAQMIDPKLVIAGQQATLSPARLETQIQLIQSGTPRQTPITLFQNGVVYDGTHGTAAALITDQAQIPVVVIEGAGTTRTGLSPAALPVRSQ